MSNANTVTLIPHVNKKNRQQNLVLPRKIFGNVEKVVYHPKKKMFWIK